MPSACASRGAFDRQAEGEAYSGVVAAAADAAVKRT